MCVLAIELAARSLPIEEAAKFRCRPNLVSTWTLLQGQLLYMSFKNVVISGLLKSTPSACNLCSLVETNVSKQRGHAVVSIADKRSKSRSLCSDGTWGFTSNAKLQCQRLNGRKQRRKRFPAVIMVVLNANANVECVQIGANGCHKRCRWFWSSWKYDLLQACTGEETDVANWSAESPFLSVLKISVMRSIGGVITAKISISLGSRSGADIQLTAFLQRVPSRAL